MIYLSNIRINGLRSFGPDSESINLNIPDGSPGSGLTIFTGPNASGKTSILESLASLVYYNFPKISSQEFNSKSEGVIKIEADFHEPKNFKMVDPWKFYFPVKAIKFSISERDRKSPMKAFSSIYTKNRTVEPQSRKHAKYKGGKEEIGDFYLSFDNDRFVEDSGLSGFYFDLSRNYQTKNRYGTTFSRLAEDLQWKYKKKKPVKNIEEKWKKLRDEMVQHNFTNIDNVIKNFFGFMGFERLKIDFLDPRDPFKQAFMGVIQNDDICFSLEGLGSGTEMIFSLLFLKAISDVSKGSIFYIIDEPEQCLHPQWQKALFDYLKEESKNKQIFIATHSPYFVDKDTLSSVRKVESNKCTPKISKMSEKSLGDDKLVELFALENREILFANKVIMVEGWEDRSRLMRFMKSENINAFVIAGLQNIKRVREFCKDLAIDFNCLVDIDYLRDKDLVKGGFDKNIIDSLEETKRLEKLIERESNEMLKKELKKLYSRIKEKTDTLLSSKMLKKMKEDTTYDTGINSLIEEEKQKGILVLKGTIESYLDKKGQGTNDDNLEELKNFFS